MSEDECDGAQTVGEEDLITESCWLFQKSCV